MQGKPKRGQRGPAVRVGNGGNGGGGFRRPVVLGVILSDSGRKEGEKGNWGTGRGK